MIASILRISLAVAALGALGGAAYIRLAPMDPRQWHVDPGAARRDGRTNDFLVGPSGDLPAIAVPDAPPEAMARLDAVAMAEPGTSRLAGTPGADFVTYVQRSRLMGFPDAISVRAIPQGTGSLMTIWSRSRYGKSDLGVNRARVARWLREANL